MNLEGSMDDLDIHLVRPGAVRSLPCEAIRLPAVVPFLPLPAAPAGSGEEQNRDHDAPRMPLQAPPDRTSKA